MPTTHLLLFIAHVIGTVVMVITAAFVAHRPRSSRERSGREGAERTPHGEIAEVVGRW